LLTLGSTNIELEMH